ncbi:uncharacterized protein CLUP02_06451 [Colletotrichum lupini]|uniref:Uncharacterized protein n=1 Tax=Colletotrichum lupini TaxID=145971 RepID=A0A9Q8SQ15_9PEZI|nr:uncharacterized protein CLUP02_06451 [Colletotrichum lupini]UQC80965.1 hypothetical protein CLUP02_06451 [Colletotrichum lupini]
MPYPLGTFGLLKGLELLLSCPQAVTLAADCLGQFKSETFNVPQAPSRSGVRSNCGVGGGMVHGQHSSTPTAYSTTGSAYTRVPEFESQQRCSPQFSIWGANSFGFFQDLIIHSMAIPNFDYVLATHSLFHQHRTLSFSSSSPTASQGIMYRSSMTGSWMFCPEDALEAEAGQKLFRSFKSCPM